MEKIVLASLVATALLAACSNDVNLESSGGAGGHPAIDAGQPDDGGQPDAGGCVDTAMDVSAGCGGCVGPTTCGCETEAAAYLQAIAQSVAAAYQAKGQLCGSASAVPAMILPPHWKYHINDNEGSDFHTGDDTSGWKCIGFAPTAPVHCQYRYQFGSGYLGPDVGGLDPGPMGFEISARADWDGDDSLSTYTITGAIDPVTGELVLSPLFMHNPLE